MCSDTHLDEVSIDFTTEELCCLAAWVGPSLGEAVGPPRELEPALNDAVQRGLLARRIVVDGKLAEPIAALFDVVCSPGLVVRGRSVTRGEAAAVFQLLALPEVAIQHVDRGDGLHRFTPFATSTLLFRVFDLLTLSETSSRQEHAFELAVEHLSQTLTLAEAGDREGAVRCLRREGVGGESADRFVAAFTGRIRQSAVTVLHAPEAGVSAGGELDWMDAGELGLWVVPLDSRPELAEAAGETVEIRTASADQIAATVLSFLPATE
jgi:hypothetical protein